MNTVFLMSQSDPNAFLNLISEAFPEILKADIQNPVNLTNEDLEALLNRYRNSKQNFPDLAFWILFRVPDFSIRESGGLLHSLEGSFSTTKEFFRLIHPDYVEPYLNWGLAAYKMALNKKAEIKPMATSYRVSIPLRTHDGSYCWYSQHATLVQFDADGNIISHLNTYYREGKWSPHNLRPFEACLNINERPSDQSLEESLFKRMTSFLLDVFTNKELELLRYYVKDLSVSAIEEIASFSRHTIHEYNARVLKKSRKLFQFDFKTAKDFAIYCKERGFIV